MNTVKRNELRMKIKVERRNTILLSNNKLKITTQKNIQNNYKSFLYIIARKIILKNGNKGN